MKKLSIIISIFILASILMTSCSKKQVDSQENTKGQIESQENIKTLVYADKYNVKVVGLSAGGGSSSSEVEKDILEKTSYKKDGIISKDINNLFGVKTNKKAYYDDTTIYPNINYEIDFYFTSELAAQYNTSTNRIVKLDQWDVEKDDYEYDPSFVSEVNPSSSNEEYIEYAKKVLFENAGISADGWEADVKISDSGEYTITFYKTIDGLRRNDDMQVVMSNRGEVRSYNAINSDEYFKPFESVKIDQHELTEQVGRAMAKEMSMHYNLLSYNFDFEAVAIKDELWVKATAVLTVKYNHRNGSNPPEPEEEYETPFEIGFLYEIKIAELQ